MINIAAGSAELSVNVPELNDGGSRMMSIALDTNNLVSRSPLQIPLAWLFIFEVHMISNIEGWVVSGYSVLRGCEPVLVQCFLCYS